MARVRPKKTKINVLNIVISSICGFLFIVSLIFIFGIYYKPPASSYRDPQGGMSGLANVFYFLFHLVINTIVVSICLFNLWKAEKSEKETNKHTIINYIILIIFFTLPWITQKIYGFLVN